MGISSNLIVNWNTATNMKFSLVLLFLFGIVAFAVAAPLEDTQSDPEEDDVEEPIGEEDEEEEDDDPDTKIQEGENDPRRRCRWPRRRVCRMRRKCRIVRCRPCKPRPYKKCPRICRRCVRLPVCACRWPVRG